ncbi:MAG TPA: hypothetical protein VM935_16260 [Chitinophagaceae bacterium]|jgi:anaerobic glycerol-3-phosphate dehydrogenase|nr:hypothetical protein [Chitinophagaceae bacterium]
MSPVFIKSTFTAVGLWITVFSCAQQNKVGSVVKQDTKPDTIQLVRQNAEKWFKEVYVPVHYTNPLSYQAGITTVKPISVFQAFQADTAAIGLEIRFHASQIDSPRFEGLREKLAEQRALIEKLADAQKKEKEKMVLSIRDSLDAFEEEQNNHLLSISSLNASQDSVLGRLYSMETEEYPKIVFYEIS